mmetsp:Transcript_21775/g.69544  ORF Transcript_21775/g.69544 Transcript_21775/m.69544 type:complete len:323 (-) Transcript_21775:502-1470(-)
MQLLLLPGGRSRACARDEVVANVGVPVVWRHDLLHDLFVHFSGVHRVDGIESGGRDARSLPGALSRAASHGEVGLDGHGSHVEVEKIRIDVVDRARALAAGLWRRAGKCRELVTQRASAAPVHIIERQVDGWNRLCGHGGSLVEQRPVLFQVFSERQILLLEFLHTLAQGSQVALQRASLRVSLISPLRGLLRLRGIGSKSRELCAELSDRSTFFRNDCLQGLALRRSSALGFESSLPPCLEIGLRDVELFLCPAYLLLFRGRCPLRPWRARSQANALSWLARRVLAEWGPSAGRARRRPGPQAAAWLRRVRAKLGSTRTWR